MSGQKIKIEKSPTWPFVFFPSTALESPQFATSSTSPLITIMTAVAPEQRTSTVDLSSSPCIVLNALPRCWPWSNQIWPSLSRIMRLTWWPCSPWPSNTPHVCSVGLPFTVSIICWFQCGTRRQRALLKKKKPNRRRWGWDELTKKLSWFDQLACPGLTPSIECVPARTLRSLFVTGMPVCTCCPPP